MADEVREKMSELCEAMGLHRVVSLRIEYDFSEGGPMQVTATLLPERDTAIECIAKVVSGKFVFKEDAE